MTVLTNLLQATVDHNKVELDGKVLTRPTLLVSDGTSLTYACDVDIGRKGMNAAGSEVVAPLRNVPIANGVKELLYADVGAAVRLRRSGSGRFEVVGFSQRQPGTYTRIAVTVPTPGFGPVSYTPGEPQSIGLSVRQLTYGEIEDVGGYGRVPYGAVGIYQGDTLIEVRT